MKRLKIILSVAVLLATLSGCANQKNQNNDNTTAEATTDNSDNTTSNSDSKNVDNNTNKSEDKNDN